MQDYFLDVVDWQHQSGAIWNVVLIFIQFMIIYNSHC